MSWFASSSFFNGKCGLQRCCVSLLQQQKKLHAQASTQQQPSCFACGCSGKDGLALLLTPDSTTSTTTLKLCLPPLQGGSSCHLCSRPQQRLLLGFLIKILFFQLANLNVDTDFFFLSHLMTQRGQYIFNR